MNLLIYLYNKIIICARKITKINKKRQFNKTTLNFFNRNIIIMNFTYG
jgi:hypothetical protein